VKMNTLQQDIQVRFRYSVHFTSHLFAPENLVLRSVVCAGNSHSAHRLLFVIDEELCRCHPLLLASIEAYCHVHQSVLTLAQPPIVVPGGERAKNGWDLVDKLHRAIHDTGLCRHSYVAVIGGGAVIDMVGFVAATAHRGIRLIRIPTTVLAQNDSAVGVKNGLNEFGKKNFLGTFTPPFAVINDSGLLETLSDRDWRSGISEAIKVALIKDAGFFEFLEQHVVELRARDMPTMRRLIYRCAELHMDHIASGRDPFETGSARPLDFGHWAAHKLEQLTQHKLRHGEAVAIGIALDTTYSHLAGFLSDREWKRIIGLLSAVGFVLYVRELSEYLFDPQDPRCAINGLEEFREHLGGQLTLILLDHIGHGFEVHEIDQKLLIESISLLERLVPSPPVAQEVK
jgi:3-dehydroquinate synthase